MTMLKAGVGIAIMSLLHFSASATAFAICFSLGMKRFDFGGEPSLVEVITHSTADILFFPGYQIAVAGGIHNDIAEWLLVIANSMLWGTAMYFTFLLFLKVLTNFRNRFATCGKSPNSL